MTIYPQAASWTTTMTVAGPTSATLTFPPYKWLDFSIDVTGYASGGGILALQFGVENGAIDAGTNYRHVNLIPPTTTATAWTAGIASSTTTAPTMLLLANAAITTGRCVQGRVMNRNATYHGVQWRTLNDATSDIAHPVHTYGEGSYHSAAAGRITSARLAVSGGDLNSGTMLTIQGFGPIL